MAILIFLSYIILSDGRHGLDCKLSAYLSMSERTPVRHFSMIRSFHLADLFTVANGSCGVAAIFGAMKYLLTGEEIHVYIAALLIPLALVFDVLDGRVARWRHTASALGRELDSLADVISFG